jgi:NADH-quinone oxidoreductase subunit L
MPFTSPTLIPWLPALAAVLCGLCCTQRRLRRWSAWICAGAVLWSCLISVGLIGYIQPGSAVGYRAFEWLRIGQPDDPAAFVAPMAYYVDTLTVLMLLVVTGVGFLVVVYAAGYMKGDPGYARFFAGVSLFIFAMTTLVMADNLVLLYLGWEGVGLCSYLLIGFYYKKPSAVAAAKKAFIVNRVGDLGFVLGIFLTYYEFGTVMFEVPQTDGAGLFDQFAALHHAGWTVQLIPFLLMLGAFGKSAQLPLYVWLPDAMEGPTPVSALIHAATMVTAGVYMIARMLPLFVLSPYALPTVAIVGGLTALFAATIALCQYDIKRIYAYSTISQLGYMFLGVGVLSTVGGVFHLYTHAFFKALLFLTSGSVMHALAGQLDLRKMSGLRHRMPVTCWLMFAGCLALSGFPLTAGFFSKDLILASAVERGVGEHGQTLYLVLGLMGLFTAFLTAFYTFRLWFRVFMGPEKFELGDEHHAPTPGSAPAPGSAPGNAHAAAAHESHIEHRHEPHEMPWLMNAPLFVLAAGALLAGWCGVIGGAGGEHGWVGRMIEGSTANAHAALGRAGMAEQPAAEGAGLHTLMAWVSSLFAVAGIALAAWYHWLNREAADRVAAKWPGVVRVLANKYYVDELYDAAIVRPLRALAGVCYLIDRLIIDGLVAAVAFVPRMLGLSLRPAQRGLLQGYGLGMVAGAAVIAVFVWLAMT